MRGEGKWICSLLSVGMLAGAIGCEVSADYEVLGPGEVPDNLPDPPPTPREIMFKDLDINGDDQLDKAEFSVGRGAEDAARWFERRDADDDGIISREEYLPSGPLGYAPPRKPSTN